MGITSEEKKMMEEGKERNVLSVEFSNGALEQLEDLRGFFQWKEKTDPIKFGISLLQKVKEQKEQEKIENSEMNKE